MSSAERSVDLTEARRLEAAATPAPWFHQGPLVHGPDEGGLDIGPLRGEVYEEENARLVVHLRNHATDYFDAVEALERLLAHHDRQNGDGWCEERNMARAVLARLREPAKQGSGDEEGEL